MKVAKLVHVSLITRVIIDVEDSDDDTVILDKAIPKLCENLMDSPYENTDKIEDDTENPYQIGELYSLSVGDDVLMPDPNDTDIWNFGDFVARIEKLYESNGVEYASVVDGDGDYFDIELERLDGRKELE